MKKFILSLILVMSIMVSLATASVFTDIGGWYNEHPDKISHGLLGATIAGYALKHLASPETAILDSGLVGIVKEGWDKWSGKGHVEFWDAGATLIGGILLAIL